MADTVIGSIAYDLDLDDKQFVSKMDEASGKVKRFGLDLKGAEQASKLFAGGLLAIGTAAVGAIGVGIKTAGELETMQTALETVTGSSDKAAAAMVKIKQTAKDSPFFETATLASFVQLMAASGQEIETAVASGIKFGDVAAAFGKGNAEMTRMGNTLSQVMGKGKADAVDFKELVNAGWVSVRKDTAAALGVTMEQFEEMVSAGEVGYDAISKAAEKFGGAAEKQSSSFSALMTRLKESVTTLFADLVVDTGLFDQVKVALEGLIGVIEQIDAEKVKAVLSTIAEYLPIIAGMIIGALVPAMVAAVPAVLALGASFIALLPFIAIGAAIGAAIWAIIKVVQNWGAIMEYLQGIVGVVTTAVQNAFQALSEKVLGVVTAIIGFLQTLMAPFNWLYYNVIEPILLLIGAIFARVFYEIFEVVKTVLTAAFNWIDRQYLQPLKTLFTVVWGAVQAITTTAWNAIRDRITQPINDAKNKLQTAFESVRNFISGVFNGIVSFLEGIAGRIVSAITKPFEDAKRKVEEIGQSIRNAADKINPFHKESPSLVENVIKGVGIIKDQFASLADLTFNPLAGAGELGLAGLGAGGVNQDINIAIERVGGMQDVEAMGREFGYRASLMPEMR